MHFQTFIKLVCGQVSLMSSVGTRFWLQVEPGKSLIQSIKPAYLVAGLFVLEIKGLME